MRYENIFLFYAALIKHHNIKLSHRASVIMKFFGFFNSQMFLC